MMNAVEKFLFSKEHWMENYISMMQNDATTLCGRVFRFVSLVGSSVNKSKTVIFGEFLVIDLENKIKKIIVRMPYGDKYTFSKDGSIVQERGVKRHSLKSLYAFFYTLNQIMENEEKK